MSKTIHYIECANCGETVGSYYMTCPYCGFKLIKQQPPATPGSLYGIDDETFYKATQGRGVRLCDTASHIKAVKTRLQNGW